MKKQFNFEQKFNFINKKNKPINIFEKNRKLLALKNSWYLSLFVSGFVIGVSIISSLFQSEVKAISSQHFKEPIKIKSSHNHNEFKNILDLTAYNQPNTDSIDIIMSNPTEKEINYLKNHLDSFKIIK